MDTFFNLSAFAITDTELKLMAAAAIIGESNRPNTGNNIPAAMGTPKVLYINAKKRFCSSVQFSFQENSVYDLRLKKKINPFASIAVGCLNLTERYDPQTFAYQGGDFDTY